MEHAVRRRSSANVRNVYVASFVEHLGPYVKKTLTDVNVVVLKCVREKAGTDPQLFFVEELEEGPLTGQVEVMFGDIMVLGKYRHRLTGLKWFHTGMNGVDILMKVLDEKELHMKPPYMLTRTLGDINAPETTEYVIGQIINYERCLYKALDLQKKHEWKQLALLNTRDISEVTVGILGLGALGSHLAKECKTFGMTIWGLTRRHRDEKEIIKCPYVDVHRTQENLSELLQNCDYIVNVLPSTTKTRGMLSGNTLAACQRKKSVFINVARGDIIDEDSLVKALRNGWIGGAVLDVFEVEPLLPTSPLWELPGVIITPHISGWSIQDKYWEKIADWFVTNFNRYTKGLPLKGVVDWTEEY